MSKDVDHTHSQQGICAWNRHLQLLAHTHGWNVEQKVKANGLDLTDLVDVDHVVQHVGARREHEKGAYQGKICSKKSAGKAGGLGKEVWSYRGSNNHATMILQQ